MTRAGAIAAGRLRSGVVPSAPSIFGVGTKVEGIAGATPTIPSHQTDDILVAVFECAETTGVTAPSGWAHVTGSPRAQGSNVTALTVMWKRAVSASETLTVADPGNHIVGGVLVIRGCITTGNPWSGTPVGTGGTAATTFSATGVTTAVANTRAFMVIAGNHDALTDQFSAVTNGTLVGFAKVGDYWTDQGNGGGVTIYSGTRATAGGTGTTSGSLVSGSWSALTFALAP